MIEFYFKMRMFGMIAWIVFCIVYAIVSIIRNRKP